MTLHTPQAPQLPLDAFPSFPVRSPLRRPGRADPRLPVPVPVCQTPFMFGGGELFALMQVIEA